VLLNATFGNAAELIGVYAANLLFSLGTHRAPR
jgi:hypothetical protein